MFLSTYRGPCIVLRLKQCNTEANKIDTDRRSAHAEEAKKDRFLMTCGVSYDRIIWGVVEKIDGC